MAYNKNIHNANSYITKGKDNFSKDSAKTFTGIDDP